MGRCLPSHRELGEAFTALLCVGLGFEPGSVRPWSNFCHPPGSWASLPKSLREQAGPLHWHRPSQVAGVRDEQVSDIPRLSATGAELGIWSHRVFTVGLSFPICKGDSGDSNSQGMGRPQGQNHNSALSLLAESPSCFSVSTPVHLKSF